MALPFGPRWPVAVAAGPLRSAEPLWAAGPLWATEPLWTAGTFRPAEPLRAAHLYQLPVVMLELPALAPEPEDASGPGRFTDPAERVRLASVLVDALARYGGSAP